MLLEERATHVRIKRIDKVIRETLQPLSKHIVRRHLLDTRSENPLKPVKRKLVHEVNRCKTLNRKVKHRCAHRESPIVLPCNVNLPLELLRVQHPLFDLMRGLLALYKLVNQLSGFQELVLIRVRKRAKNLVLQTVKCVLIRGVFFDDKILLILEFSVL